MARHARLAKRANRPNPREDRPPFRSSEGNLIHLDTRQHNLASRSSDPPSRAARRAVELLPRNLAQESYLEALADSTNHIVFAMGPAGCGKTLLATQFAIKGLQDGSFERIVLTRPAVSVDEQHGFLPGSLTEKMQPWLIPVLDVFKQYYSVAALTKMIADETIEIAPLAFMRGRTFRNSVVIFDEAQNSTIAQTKMVLTRIGEGSRMLVTGDLHQHDRGYETNGLGDFVRRVKLVGGRGMAVCEFTATDVERHPVIEEVLRLYAAG